MRNSFYLISIMLCGILSQIGYSQDCRMLYCNLDVRVSAGLDCQAEIIPDYLFGPGCTLTNYQLTITDLAGNVIPNPVTSEYFYTDLVVELIDLNYSDTCITNLIVEDRMLPVINSVTGPAIITCLSNLEEVFTVDATDNCEFTTEISDISYSCEDCSVITVEITWTATDIGNNQDSYTLIRDLVDFWDIITWPADFVIACEGDLPTSPVPIINDLPGCEREFIIEHFDYKAGCTINRVWEITDVGSGLQTSHTQHILINDIVAPVIIAPDVVHLSLKEYNAGWDLDYEVVDDCTADLITYVSRDIFPLSCNPEYFKIIYTITAIDDCGNQATKATVVSVKSKLNSKVKLFGKKSCYSPFQIFADVSHMSKPLSYSYSVNNLTWAVTNLGNGIAMVNPGLGKVTITVVVTDQAGCKVRSSIKFNCRKFIPKTRNVNDQEVNLYPNPTTGNLFISGIDIQEITVFNIEGKLMKTILDLMGNEVDISDLDAGIYMVKIKTASELVTKRVVKM